MDECSVSPAGAEHDGLIGRSASMSRVRELIERVGPTDATVLLVGESGTGKELVAEAVHRRSSRAGGPFVAVNCGAIPELLDRSGALRSREGQLHGRDPHAVRVSSSAQTAARCSWTRSPRCRSRCRCRCCAFLESRRYFKVGGRQEIAADVRVIAATNRAPHDAIRNRKLREDLYYRLAVFPLELPPLRERDEDAVALAEHFLALLNAASGTRKRLSAELAGSRATLQLAWQRARAAPRDRALVHPGRRHARAGRCARVGFATLAVCSSNGDGNTLQVAIGSRLRDVEKSLIEATLEHFAGNKRHTADALGCSLKTLYNKLNTYSRLAREM